MPFGTPREGSCQDVAEHIKQEQSNVGKLRNSMYRLPCIKDCLSNLCLSPQVNLESQHSTSFDQRLADDGQRSACHTAARDTDAVKSTRTRRYPKAKLRTSF